MSYRNPSYETAPPSELLPDTQIQRDLSEYLIRTPGIDIKRSIAEETTRNWPSPGFHALGLVRPGFSGNVTITPYRRAFYDPIGQDDFFELQGCGRFGTVYDNPNHQPDVPFSDRVFPDFISMPDKPAIIKLGNGGRLHVPRATTGARGGTSNRRPEQRTKPGVAVVERLLTADQVRTYMAHLAIGMGLEGKDADTFAALPERFIEELMPETDTAEPPRRTTGRILTHLLKRLNPAHFKNPS